MLVNRTQRRKKFLELAIWEVFTERKSGLLHVDEHVLRQFYSVCSVSVNFQPFEDSFSSIKGDLTESFYVERRRI